MRTTRGPDNNWLHECVITYCLDTCYAGCTVLMRFTRDDARYVRKTTSLMRFMRVLVCKEIGVAPDVFCCGLETLGQLRCFNVSDGVL